MTTRRLYLIDCVRTGHAAGPTVLRGSAMSDPLDKATSSAPATLGEGCLSRYDPDALTPENGTEFEGAAELWRSLQSTDEDDEPGKQKP